LKPLFPIFLQNGNFLTEGISQALGYLMGAPFVVVGIVLTTFRQGGMLTGLIPHMELLGAFLTESGLEVIGNLVGIDKMDMHTLGHQTGGDAVEAMGIDQGVALDGLGSVLESGVAQGFVLGLAIDLQGIVATDHTVHEDGDAALLAGLTDIALQHPLESGMGLSMPIDRGLLIVMTELDDDIITGLQLLQHLGPTAFVVERERRASIDGMIIHHNGTGEIVLQGHAPPSLRRTGGQVFLSSGGITDDENGGSLLLRKRC